MSDNSVLVRLLALGFSIAAGLPSPARAQSASAPVQTGWVSQDIGLQTPASPVQFDNDRLTISAAAGTPGAADRFRFVYQVLSGDVRITARLDSLTPAHLWSNAGLMIRRSLEPDAPYGAIMVRGDSAVALQTRIENGGLTASRGGSLASGDGPRWLGLERTGSRVTAYTSPDGNTWTAIGSESIELGADVHVGIAVSSEGAEQTASAQLSQVSIGGLPAGMRHRNIGGAAVAGTAWHSEGTYALTARGAAAGNTRDRLHFAYRRMPADFDVVARVASLAAGANAGVMIRESLAADSRHVALLVSERNGYAFDRRGETGVPAERTDGGQAGIPAWLKLVRSGAQVEVFRSEDGLTWTSIGTAPLATTGQVFVGIAVSADSTGVEATAVLDHVSIEPASVPASPLPLTLPPLVSLASPENGATFTAPATITMSASALDPELRMARVEFYAGSTLLGSDTSSPYSFTWTSAPAGSHTLKARAFDADGGQATSSTVTITVQPGANQAPAVTLTSPANGATFTAPATVDISATASDPENELARVEFYQGSTLLGADSSAPYAFTWSSVPDGSYTLTARAFDSAGAQAMSAAVTITVSTPPPPAPRLVLMTASTDHDDSVSSYLLEVFASGADPETASPVATSGLGKPSPDTNREISVDRASFFAALAPGNYIATVKAVGPDGTARSTPVAFTR